MLIAASNSLANCRFREIGPEDERQDGSRSSHAQHYGGRIGSEQIVTAGIPDSYSPAMVRTVPAATRP